MQKSMPTNHFNHYVIEVNDNEITVHIDPIIKDERMRRKIYKHAFDYLSDNWCEYFNGPKADNTRGS